MIDIITILILINSFAIFFLGFSFRRGNSKIMIISSLIILFMWGLAMMIDGIVNYFHIISNADKKDVIISIIYVLVWFLAGYIMGGFQKVPSYIKIAKVKLDRGEIQIENERKMKGE